MDFFTENSIILIDIRLYRLSTFLERSLVICIYQGIGPFYLSCGICRHRVTIVFTILLKSAGLVVIFLFCHDIGNLFFLSLFFVNMAKGWSILRLFQTTRFFIAFSVFSFFPNVFSFFPNVIAFCSNLNYFLPLLVLGLICPPFSNFFRWMLDNWFENFVLF